LIIVKLGGSVITDKETLRSFRRLACMRLCKELRAARNDMILVHGAGSFGHILASRAGLQFGVEKGDLKKLKAVAKVHQDVRELNSKVLDCLGKNRMKGFSIPPYTVASFASGKMIDFCPDNFERLMDNNMLPVSFGDVVPDRDITFSICSGDLIMLALAEHFRPEKVIFVADVDGVFDKDPKRYKKAKLIPTISSSNIGDISAGTRNKDVTGAMKNKLTRMIEISRHCENCIILNGNVAGRLKDAIEGKDVPCTKVVA